MKKPKLKVEINREVKLYSDLLRGSKVLLENKQPDFELEYYEILGSIIMLAFGFEAYLNHIGSITIKHWSYLEKDRVLNKYKLLCDEFGIEIDKSKRPYQSLYELFKIRNAIAHGNSEMVYQYKEVLYEEKYESYRPSSTIEKQIKVNNILRIREDVELAISQINQHSIKDENLFKLGRTITSFKESDD